MDAAEIPDVACVPRVRPLHELVSANHVTLHYKPGSAALDGLPLGDSCNVLASGVVSDDKTQVRCALCLPFQCRRNAFAMSRSKTTESQHVMRAGCSGPASRAHVTALCRKGPPPHHIMDGRRERQSSRCGRSVGASCSQHWPDNCHCTAGPGIENSLWVVKLTDPAVHPAARRRPGGRHVRWGGG